jgi:acyl dehydratase
MEIGKSIDEITIGEEASFTKTITEVDMAMFAAMTGDFNPLHMDEVYAQKTPYGRRLAHEGIAGSLVAPLMGMRVPGLGTIALEFHYKYLAPVYPGDTITCTGIVQGKDIERNIVSLLYTLTNQDGVKVIECQAKVMPPKKAN